MNTIDQLKDETIAKFLNWFQEKGQEGTWFIIDGYAKYVVYSIHNNYPYRDLPFSRSWEYLHKVWEKFRNLNFDHNEDHRELHYEYKRNIIASMTYKDKVDVYNDLLRGIEWYNQLEK